MLVRSPAERASMGDFSPAEAGQRERDNHESGENLGLRGGSGEWVMEAAVEDGGADLKHAVCAAR